MKKFTFISLILLLLASAPLTGFAQAGNPSPLTVRGVVTDESGTPMSGVTVIAPQGSAVTNNLGEYTVSTPPDGTLTFSFLGYATQNVPVNGRAMINVSMNEETNILDDVIVIGYGTTTRRRATGAVDQVKASQIADRSVANMSQALQGTSPSLVIQNRSFNPTSQRNNINIRGLGTFNNNSPLLVVDGIVMNDTGALSRINPADIESVSILKDAGTAAIYGSRAANGVILMTTKQGRKNQAPTVQLNVMLGVQEPHRLFEPVQGYQNAVLKNIALMNSPLEKNHNPEFTQAQIRDLYENGNGNNFFDEITKPAFQQSYNASVSGGSSNTSYLVSGGYFDQRSNLVGPDYGMRRYNFRTNVTTEHGRFKVNGNIAYTRTNSVTTTADEGNVISDVTRVPTYYYNKQRDPETGKYVINSSLRQFNSLGLLEAGGTNKYDNDFLTGNASLDFRIIEGLKLRGVIGAEIGNEHRYTRTHQVEFYNLDDMTAAPMLSNTDNISEDWSKKSWMVDMQIMADFDRYFGKHHVTALIGGSNESYQDQGHQVRVKFSDPDLGIKGDKSVIDPDGSYVTPESTTRRGISSLFGRVGYDYNDKYFFESSFRYDGSSKFEPEYRWGFFPSFSLSWRLSEEGFMDWWKYNMGEMKLRGTFGTLGNQNVDDYSYFTTWSFNQNSYGFNNLPVAGAIFQEGSRNLQWEVTRTWNLGLDVSFFKNSLNVTFDCFIRNTSKILTTPQQVPDLYGTIPKNTNNGAMRTEGWEFTINYFLRTGKVNHTFNFNMGDSWNEVRKYGVYEQTTKQEELWHLIRIGMPYKSYYGYKTDGFFQSQAEADANAQFSGQKFVAGDPKYLDRDGNGVLDTNDLYYLGNAFPRYTFGFTYSLEWNGLDFNIFLQGVLKRSLNIRGELVEPFHETYGHTMYAHQLDYWTPTNTDATWPRLAKDNFVYQKPYGSNLYIFNGAYMRIKNIQVGYTLPQKWTQKAGMSKLRIYVNAQNPVTFAATNFVDPEASEFDSNMSGGSNYNRNYPTLRYWGGGLDITF